MKAILFLKTLLFCTILFSSCNKNDDAQCEKNENFFEATFNNDIIKPYYNQGGGFGLYTLYQQQCPEANESWLLTVRTENNLSLYISLIELIDVGNYRISDGNPNHIAIDCAETTTIYIEDETTNTYTYISSNNGEVKITEYDPKFGKIVGSFTAEMVSTANPSIIKTISGEFNLNKSTLDNTKKPCWL